VNVNGGCTVGEKEKEKEKENEKEKERVAKRCWAKSMVARKLSEPSL
jgi:hypothetical protein